MNTLKENLEGLWEFLYPLFKIVIAFAIFWFLFTGIIYFTIKIDTSRLGEIRHCPSCGIDLLHLK